MPKGFVLNISKQMLDRLDVADTKIKQLATTSEQAQQRIVAAFQQMSTQGVKAFIDQLKEVNQLMGNMGNMKMPKGGLVVVTQEATKGVDKVNDLTDAIVKMQEIKVSNGALERVNYEIEQAIKRLSELQTKMNFFAQGEGSKSIGVNTSSWEREADGLMQRIFALTQEREEIQKNAKARYIAAQQQTEIDRQWYAMERQRIATIKENARIENELAKQRIQEYLSGDKNDRRDEQIRLAEQQKMYERLFGKIARLEEKLMSLYNKQNKAAKESIETSRREWSDRVSIWERGFAEIERLARENAEKQSQIARENTQRYIAEEQEKEKYTRERVQMLNDLALQQEAGWTAQNQQAKLGGVNARIDYNAQIRAYEQMFDEIERKRQENLKREQEAAKAQAEADKRRAHQVIDNYNREMEAARRSYEERQRMYEQLFSQRTPDELISARGQAKTLSELQKYAREIENAMANLDPKSKEWQKLNEIYKQTNREIKNINNSMKDMDGKQKSLINTADQLKRAFALAFSVSAIKGYVTQIARVRGEFELQQRSLQAILQNRNAANKIWEQTIDLAVRSPFQVKELVTYTKQLASYRVESDKLFDTTKRLADVSAGLGVDMQRLILAYGQVKAANYLRGTELRQFSEAGINILSELSKYFTELEGRAVSVGEVFDRVSKRMVAFSDVEEIFKRITSEGGLFYNMQEIQADTLKGQISNLRDAIDIMLNAIGQENEGVLKNTVKALRTLIENWREIEWWLVRIVPAMGAYKMATFAITAANAGFGKSLVNVLFNITAFAEKIGIGGKVLQSFGLRLASLGKFATMGIAGGLLAIGLAIFEIRRRATKASRELKRLNEELDKMFTEDKTAVDKQIKNFENLVNRLKLVNKGSKEHRDIINRLNQDYGEYLGYIVNENTTYEKLKSSIDSVNQALVNKAKLASYEKAYGKIMESTASGIIEAQKSIRNFFTEKGVNKDGFAILPTTEEINDVFAIFEKKVLEQGNNNNIFKLWQDAFSQYGWRIPTQGEYLEELADYADYILQRKQQEIDLENSINAIYGHGVALTAKMREEQEALAKAEENELKGVTSRRKQDEIRLKYAEKRVALQGKFEGKSDDAIAFDISKLRQQSATIIDVNQKIMESADKLGEKYADMIYIDASRADKGINEIAKSAAGFYQMQNEIIKEQEALKKAGTVHDEEKLENARKSAKAYEYLLKLLGREDLLKPKGKDEVAERLRNQINLIKEMNKEYEKLAKIMPKELAIAQVKKSYAPTAKTLGLDISSMTFDDTSTINALEGLIKVFPVRLKTEIQKALDNYKVEIGIVARENSLEKLKKDAEDYLERFDLSRSFDEMGISPEFAKKFFGFDYISEDALSTIVQNSKKAFEQFGTEGIKEWNNFSNKVTEIERKAQEERLKTYLQYARNSVGERAKIKLEELRKLAEIERTFTKPEQAQEKQAAQQAVKQESYQATQKLEWEEFQKTDTFINLFKDLDSASTTLINHAITKLNEFKDNWKDMPLEDMRSIVGKLNELENALVLANPFQSARDLRKGGAGKKGNVEALQEEAIDTESKLVASEQELAILETILRLKQEGKQAEAESYAIANNKASVAKEETSTIAQMVSDKNKETKDLKKQLTTTNQKLSKEKQLVSAYKAQADAIGDAQKMANDLIDSFSELAEVLGADGDGIGMTFVNMGQDMMNTVLNTIMLQIQLNAAAVAAQGLGAAMNTAMGVVGWIVMAVQLLTQALTAIFKAKDKALQNQIDALAKSAEDLQEKFDELSDSIDEIYSSDALAKTNKDLQETNKLLLDNLKAQKALQQERKQTDKVKEEIEALDKAIIEAEQDLIDAQKEVFSHATDGILDSAMDAARGFVDAWYDAFKETGNGMKGLEDNFQEMLLNMVKQQAALQIMQPFIDDWVADLKNYIDVEKGDTKLTVDEAKAWAAAVREDFPELSAALEALFGALDDTLGGSGSLSGLEKGIAGASEETIQVLAAYANSCRGFLASIDSKLNEVATRVFSNEDNENPILSQLRIVAQQTSAINSLLSSLTKGGHSEGGMGLKVFIN